MLGLRHQAAQSGRTILNQATTVLPVGARRGHRLPDEPVQHRRRRPVPPRRASPPRSSAAALHLPAPLHVAAHRRGRDARRRRRGPASPALLKVTRGVSEVISTIMLNASPPALDRLPAAPGRRSSVAGSNNIGTKPIPASGAGPRHPADPRQRRWTSTASSSSPSSSASPTRCCSAAPGSASTCGPPAGRDGGRRQRRQRASGWSSSRCCSPARSPAWSACRSCSAQAYTYSAGLPGRASASPASPSRCSAATTRSASRSPRCSGRSSTRRRPILDLNGVPKEIVPIMQGIARAVGRHRLRAGPPLRRRGRAAPGRPRSSDGRRAAAAPAEAAA